MQQANKNEVRKEIADLINRIKEQSDRIGMQREIPQSELDLILHRIEELHRKTVVWSFLNELPVETTDDRRETGVETPLSLSTLDSARSDNAEVISVQVVEEVKKVEPIIVAPPIVPEQVQPVVVPKTELSDREPVLSVVEGESRADKGEPKAEKVESAKQLKDVKSFIGFNEKLMYIRQVFGGNNDAYNAALEQINTMNTWTEAETFLGVLATEYKWGKENEPVAIFTHTVKQRFI